MKSLSEERGINKTSRKKKLLFLLISTPENVSRETFSGNELLKQGNYVLKKLFKNYKFIADFKMGETVFKNYYDSKKHLKNKKDLGEHIKMMPGHFDVYGLAYSRSRRSFCKVPFFVDTVTIPKASRKTIAEET